jgi:histidine ammonia-lyase
MATHGAYRLRTMLGNVRAIVAVELLAAVRAIGFRRPLRTSPLLESAVARVATADDTGDRFIAPDIERVAELIASGAFTLLVAELFESTDGTV